MTKAEETALKAYPIHSVLIQPARRGGYYADGHLRDGFIKGYEQAEKDLLANAVDAEVWGSSGGIKAVAVPYRALDKMLKNFTSGETVKIIIIKDDETIND